MFELFGIYNTLEGRVIMYVLTKQCMKRLVEEIVYAVHESKNDERAKEWVQEVLEDRGIVEVEGEDTNE